ncbi:ABC transporter permease [Ferruginibacter profundus]
MFRNYLKLAWRNLFKKKIYSLINFTGLSVAAAFTILIFLYVQHENQFDRFHKNEKNLYRLEVTNIFNFDGESPQKNFFSFLYKSDQVRNNLRLPIPLPEALKNNFPEIKSFVRLQSGGRMVVRSNNQSFKLNNQAVALAENNFFSVFSFPLLKGDATTVLQQPNNIVITESAAKRYFGDDNPIGKTINLVIRDEKPFIVTGVAKDFPASSSMQFEMVIPLQASPGFEKNRTAVGQFSHLAILQLQDGIDAKAFGVKLDAFCKNYFAALNKPGDKDAKVMHGYLRPLAEAHFNSSDGWFHYTNLERIFQLIALTIILLLIVCINYVLLTLTSTAARSQEVGIRKTIGAERKQIVAQFWVETQLLVTISVLAGFVIATIAMPFFNNLVGANIKIENISAALIIGMLLVLSVVLGLLAGIFPALAISGLKPLKIMRGHATYKLNPRLSKTFVVIQYTSCIVLIISSLVIFRQMKFMLHKDLGFDKEQVVVIKAPDSYNNPNTNLMKERFYQFAAKDPGITNVTATTFTFSDGFNMNSHLINDKQEMVSELSVDYNYFDFNKIPIIKGRAFSPDMPTDTAAFEIPVALIDSQSSSTSMAIIVNETLYNMLGKPPMDEINKPMGGRIIGVSKDYHFWGLTQKIGPAYHLCSPTVSAFYWCKIKPGQDIPQVMDRIHTNWNAITNSAPFEFNFMDETVQRFYEPYQKWMQTINLFSWIAIFVSCLGFFGLSGLNAINRTKEVGIRKILGASITEIYMLLNKEFIVLIAVAILVAVPLANYFMYSWLENFAYKIKISWTIYIIGAGIALLCAAFAIGYHTIKAALSNPVKSLRTE